MPAPTAAGAVVGVVGRLAGKKGAQAAAGAEEAVEGGAKAVAGKVQQGLGMVQANQQQAQQKRQNMQQRLQDATREGASTGSTIGKAVLVKERKSPEAMRHKREYDKKYESSPERVKYREELNRERRRRGIYGSHDHMDVSHTEGGGLTLESQHANRGRHFKDKGTLRVVKARDVRDFTEQYPDLQFRQTDVLEDPLETYGLSTTPREPMLSSNKFSTRLTPTSNFANAQFRTMDPARVAILQRFADRSRVKRPVKIEQTVGMGENADFGPHSNLSDMSSLYDDYFLESANYAQPPYSDEEIQAYREQFPKTRFDDRMTMQDIRNFKKSLSEDLELLRNLLAGPMDEQDKKIGLAMVGMLEERHENDDEEEEEDKFKHKYHGGFL